MLDPGPVLVLTQNFYEHIAPVALLGGPLQPAQIVLAV